MTNEEILNNFNHKNDQGWLQKRIDRQYFMDEVCQLMELARRQGAEEQRDKDADKVYRRAIQLQNDSHVQVALVDISINIRTQGEEGAKVG